MIPVEDKIKSLWDLGARWHDDALEFLRTSAPRIIVIIVIAVVLVKLLRMLTRRLTMFSRTQGLPSGVRAQQLRTLASVINGVGMFVIFFVTLMQVLGVLQINIGPLLASAGVAGLAIGFGAQALVKDVINGFFILMENQYDVGDIVKISGVSGTVEHLTLRRTVLRDSDGALHNIPNSEIKIVSNLTRDWTQVALHVSVSYEEESDRVVGLLKQIGEELYNDPQYAEMLVAAPDVPGIERIDAGQVEYLVLIKTRPSAQYAVSRELRRRIKACFQKNNVQASTPAPMYVLK